MSADGEDIVPLPHGSAVIAHSAQTDCAHSLSRAIAAAASSQIAAQSMSSAMQRAIIFTSCS